MISFETVNHSYNVIYSSIFSSIDRSCFTLWASMLPLLSPYFTVFWRVLLIFVKFTWESERLIDDDDGIIKYLSRKYPINYVSGMLEISTLIRDSFRESTKNTNISSRSLIVMIPKKSFFSLSQTADHWMFWSTIIAYMHCQRDDSWFNTTI